MNNKRTKLFRVFLDQKNKSYLFCQYVDTSNKRTYLFRESDGVHDFDLLVKHRSGILQFSRVAEHGAVTRAALQNPEERMGERRMIRGNTPVLWCR